MIYMLGMQEGMQYEAITYSLRLISDRMTL